MTRASATGPERRAAPPHAALPINLMIVDDSAIARAVLSRMLAAYRDFEVVALAANAGEALDALKAVRVDIVLLDVEMPGTSGLEALPDILREGRGARVLILSSLCEDRAEATVKGLALGAADTLPKPGTGTFGGRFAEVLAERLRRIGPAAPAPAPSAAAAAEASSVRLRAMSTENFACLALGASTGGLHAIGEFLKTLPSRIGVPILVTQHLPVLFMPFFARQIEAVSGRGAQVAQSGTILEPERILVAPGDAHLALERRGTAVGVKLCRAPAGSGCMPSVDPMFGAVSEIYGPSGLGIVFSGMGRDGLTGSARIVDRGGSVLVQDRATSAVWGMPRAVAEAGLASAMLSPADLARRISGRPAAAAWK
ncbi:MAG TPA: chemotaxis protein CheB [Allosphingosinicella sp.]|nr:chemotaxis protein CheB [Allosphingosinicella sp.]